MEEVPVYHHVPQPRSYCQCYRSRPLRNALTMCRGLVAELSTRHDSLYRASIWICGKTALTVNINSGYSHQHPLIIT